MLGKTTKFSAILFGILVFFISACSTTREAPGILVKDFKEPSALSTPDLQAQQQKEAEEIVRLSQVKENSVFT
ncbi:MAG: hypothetical protein WCH07_09420, partial [Deltaproteobacteria bacterium]